MSIFFPKSSKKVLHSSADSILGIAIEYGSDDKDFNIFISSLYSSVSNALIRNKNLSG